jgi:TetR/AcrR family transcriptional regulator, transcriptional repressor for nem operon
MAIGHRQMVRVETLVVRQLTLAGIVPALATARARALLSMAMGATILRKAGVEAGGIDAVLSAAEPLIVSTT